ncbi:hypothetical protein P153DRAFT_338231 [Dothidotthia symphoricarpi CBS 119687]|uniref:HTH APSES-type domain-containing protein n=1 Tax=Dothidotthia symphoricarpi CBS 119687 TaxID=1392245 RepID=A0A6A6AH61_9PLEO|nr:uncharacterized protein P153DRAFT_338231 [Dothidotthia symphoricarpi CBS 119687]KAF2130435.1 hypothetical protein P153DRAFT_338231 [Dothidotthia symphoricarpi CBS 119687]
MRIQQMLNPLCGDHHGCENLELPTLPSMPRLTAPITGPRRQKVPKDAPVFSEGNKIIGHLNYPPYEAGDDHDLAAQHRKFQIYPLGEIQRKGVRHIPYNSDKKDFLDKTGRDAFEMFQYTYKRPGEEKEYVVVWDYNVGLVRMTPFFKSCKYSKTIPAKALRDNPGLKHISYSITGGALVCQGYWMPYQAAKAIAATFCYDIRWALTPVFGNDFPSMCVHPKSTSFAKFVIDPTIVQYCTEQTNKFRIEGASYRILGSNLSSPVATPQLQFGSPPWEANVLRQHYGRQLESESGYGTDTDRSDRYLFSPQVSPRSQFTAVNSFRSLSPPSPRTNTTSSTLGSPTNAQFPPRIVLPTSVPDGYYEEHLRMKRTHSKVAFSDNCDDELPSRPRTAATVNSDGGYDTVNFGESGHTQREIDAAEHLMMLSASDKMLPPPTKRTRCGSKY